MNWQKYVFHWEKINFRPFANSAHTVKLLALGKTKNICINDLMFYPSRQLVKRKHFKYKFTLTMIL